MIEEPPLLTIKRPARRPTDAQIAAFQGVPTGFVVDAMMGGGTMASTIRPLGEGRDLNCVAAGPALTVETGPADILALLAALGSIQDGDVVVSSFAAHQGCAAAGDRVSAMMKNCGAAGFVTDGPARDYAGIVAVGLPIWCTGLTPNTPFGKGPGTVGLPIQSGGLEVETGDMIVADMDGVVVVPFERLDEVLAQLQKVQDLEAALHADLQEGLKVPPDIETLLKSDQVRYVD
ncbi:S-adenosylmethionine:2-demethylmenaquinone methyltransferase [Candidatus Rhodobacter oscarellae]|uniref:Putative 4-hydroxy-4-methyl-2-oxoglutarate aldolase n=1 Tax=Candidatus Rhodobacter oscarellae TaxID=1675527 RepID=A0A0J9EFX6_9RHOB|nr:RraA family protein [Candidatus Rhodobacter lobularis]KMW60599.1 S-adenosylmethionine:2-demethylmenaquinone methyltransferase [Candidatus Rhodobacter lobularis]